MAVFSWVYSLLPNFYITGSRVEWKGRTYKECRAESRWVLGKCIAKDVSGQRLYALKGDKYKKYHMIVLDNRLLFIEYDYGIPEEGDLTGIIVEYTVDPDNWMNHTRHNRYFEKNALEEIVDQSLSATQFEKFESDTYIEVNKFYKMHLCYNDYPVSDKCIGYVGELEGQIYFLRGEDAIVGPAGTEDYKVYIKRDTEYFILNSQETEKELKKIKKSFHH